MKYLITILLTSLVTMQCIAMDNKELQTARRAFGNAIVLGEIEKINFAQLPSGWSDRGLYIACNAKKYDIMQELLKHGADQTSIYAQLALTQAQITKDVTATQILSQTTELSLDEAVAWATKLQFNDLLKNLLDYLFTYRPELLESDLVKLGLAYANYNQNEISYYHLTLYIAELEPLEELLLICKCNAHDLVIKLLDDNSFDIKELLSALETAIANKADQAKQCILNYILKKNLISKPLDELLLICKCNAPDLVIELLNDQAFNMKDILTALKITIANKADLAKRCILDYIYKRNLVSEAIVYACENDLETIFIPLLGLNFTIESYNSVYNLAIKYNALRVLQKLNPVHPRTNTLKLLAD